MVQALLNEADIFQHAREIHEPDARAEYLQEACGDNAALRGRIVALLQIAEEEQSFLEHSTNLLDATVGMSLVAEAPGTIIGPYKLLEQIGEGGFGVVFVAEQSHPVRRKVALKILKPGMDTRQVIARFEAERQALALMDHPHIAKVLDAGATETGRPYFVMELVNGIPITEYCEQSHLGMRERLQLFVDVCHAVQHAHQKGIIHRDLKPSNVLVTQIDGKPVAKVIDFGIAKATGQQLTDKTPYTAFAQLIGTPLYMSPEQAALSGVDVDTRSDVYSLGVMLYELLTGTTPFTRETLSNVGYDELRRIITEEEPPRPSTRLSTLQAQNVLTVATRQHVGAQQLSRQLRGELDWIVMQALEKDRNRRYESASAFAADVERYLNDEPVQACPPSAGYRFRKFIRKHRVTLTTAAAVAATLVIGTGVSVWQAVVANSARHIADERLELANDRLTREQRANREAEAQRRRADAERQRADAERQKAETQFEQALDTLNRLLTRTGPESLRNVPQIAGVQKRIVKDAQEFYQSFLSDRSANPNLRLKAAQAYKATVFIYRELNGIPRVETENMLESLAEVYSELHAAQPEDSRIALELAGLQRWLARYKPDLEMKKEYLQRAIELVQPIVEHADHDATWNDGRFELLACVSELGVLLKTVGEFAQAERHLRNALTLGLPTRHDRDKYSLAGAYYQLGLLLELNKQLPEALAQFQHALALEHEIFEQFPEKVEYRESYAEVCHGFAEVLNRAQRNEQAVPYFERAFETRERLHRDFPGAPRFQNQRDASQIALLLGYRQLGKTAEARQLIQRSDPRTAAEFVSRGRLFQTVDDHQQAITDFTEAIRLNQDDVATSNNLAWLLATCPDSQLRDGAQAVQLAQQAIKLAPSGSSWNTLGAAQYRARDWSAAIAALEKSMELRKGGDSFDWFFLAMAHWQLGEKDQARQWYDRAVDWMNQTQPQNEELQRFRDEAMALLNVNKQPQ